MIRPLRDKIVVKEISQETKKDVYLPNGSIYVHKDSLKEFFRLVEVCMLGDLEVLKNNLKIGDKVLIRSGSTASNYCDNGIDYLILGYDDIYGVIE